MNLKADLPPADCELTAKARQIWDAGVNAVRADALVHANVQFDEEYLYVGELALPRASFDRIHVVGAGKAVAAMALALDRVLSPAFSVTGWVNVPEQTFDVRDAERCRITIFPARPVGANEPTERVLEGTRRMLQQVQGLSSRDLCLVLLSGGGSALLSLPVDGVSLEDKIAVARLLSGSGANIQQLNTVRKPLSQVKGGRLAAACNAGQLITLVISDVLGDALDVIASGPTVPDTSTPHDALEILNKFDPLRKLPASVYRALQSAPSSPSTVSQGSWKAWFKRAAPSLPGEVESRVVMLGNNATAVDAAGIRAESLGFSHAMTAARTHEGSAESVGAHHAEMAVSMLADRDQGKGTPDCLITGGEPTVQLAPAQQRGKGGRNMHLVLAAMKRLIDLQIPAAKLHRIVILSGGTDGEDGPTDAAGAILDASVWNRAKELQLDPTDFLIRSDSYTFFERTGGLLVTGPTQTNVCDLRVIVLR